MSEQKGGIKLAVFDWAGTTVDYGSMTPMKVFDSVFRDSGIELTRREIAGPMGREKKDHIRELLKLSQAGEQWRHTHGADWTEQDVEEMYRKFEETLAACVAERAHPLDQVAETVEILRKRGIVIGSTTGYTAEIMEKVLRVAEADGYKPDYVITPEVTGIGRPSPFMMYECMRRAAVYPPKLVVKIGDTLADIAEGKNGGAWTIGLLTGSNLLGLDEKEAEIMDVGELNERKEKARMKYLEAGADFVADQFSDLPGIFDVIETRIRE